MAVPIQGTSYDVKILYANLMRLQGIYYFFSHPFLYPLLKARLIPCAVLSFLVLSILFTFTYLPQVAFLAIFHGPLAWVNGAFLVLGEGAIIIQGSFEAFFVDEALVDIFDAVLINEGLTDLLAPSREIHADGRTPVQRLGKPKKSAVYSPFSIRLIIEFVLFLPFNLIPIFGTPLFLVLTGHRAGPLHHWRYYKLLDLPKKERMAEIRRRRLQYTWFGTAALTLQLVPLLSMLFLLTTAAGSALWAARLEKQKRAFTGRPVPHVRVPADVIDPSVDDPPSSEDNIEQ